VLLDAGATKAALKSAFSRVAATAKSDDLFVFYFTGFGEASATGEVMWPLSGYGEKISAAEINSLVGSIPSNNKAIFVDSCYAGVLAEQ
jgi:hypothetical protein